MAAVGGADLHGEEIGLAFDDGGAGCAVGAAFPRSRLWGLSLDGSAKTIGAQVMEELVNRRLQVQPRACAPGAHAPLYRIEGDGGIQAEGERLHEISVVDLADIGWTRAEFQYLVDGPGQARSHAECCGVVVARARGDNGERRAVGSPAFHQTAGHLVDQAVAAEGDHSRRFGGQLGRKLGGMARPLGQQQVKPLVADACAQAARRLHGRPGPTAVLGGGVGDQGDRAGKTR